MKIGFIGNGNMGNAILSGIIKSELIEKEDIIVSGKSKEKLEKTRDIYKVNTTLDNKEVGKISDIIILAVKPNIYPKVIGEIKKLVKKNVIIINIAAGVSIEDIENYFERELKVVKAMPNTPAMVGEGMTAISFNDLLEEVDRENIKEIFNSLGKIEVVEEKLMDVVTALSGSSPAYMYLFIEAMADAAVLGGMTREKSYKMAAQAMIGAGRMILETNKYPGELKDMVTSPGGTTIEAVAKLEEKGFRDSIISAMRVCMEKSKKMSE